MCARLELELGARVSPGNTFITFSGDPDHRSRVSKFQPCPPSTIELGLVARETLDIDDANATLAEWRRATFSGPSHPGLRTDG